MDWCLYDRDLRHESFNLRWSSFITLYSEVLLKTNICWRCSNEKHYSSIFQTGKSKEFYIIFIKNKSKANKTEGQAILI